ncbi:MAG TPA: hypothetical protein VM597_29205 [Gemmataceae bacterium]|nr:hypothetical protein [Gemmataceae bacterium]
MPRTPIKRPKPSRWNALLGWELLRVSRRTGALAIGRFVLGASLLGIMWLLYSAEFARYDRLEGNATEIAKRLSEFAGAFALTFFFVQLTIVLLLTPIFVAGSVFEERDTRSGEVLLTTDLTRREIFYGKYLARVVQVMMIVAAGLPILALTFLWGGVSMIFIVVSYVVTFLCIFSSGAIAVSVAGGSETFREAILKAYGYILVFHGLIVPASPYMVIGTAQFENFGTVCTGILFLPAQLLITFISLGYGLRWLRLAMLRQRKRITAELAEKMANRHPPVAQESPLVWKEKYVSAQTKTVQAAILGVSIGVAVLMGLIVVLSIQEPGGWLLSFIVPLALLGAAVTVGVGAASGVATERQKNTLIDLFMIPGGRAEILRAKFVGALWRGRWPVALVGLLLPMAFVNGSPLVALPLVALAAVAYLVFGAALGVWLSVRCKSALSATAAWVGTVGLGLIGTFLVADASATWNYDTKERERPEWGPVVNPALALYELSMHPDRGPGYSTYGLHPFLVVPDKPPRLLAPLAGVTLYAAAGGLLWLLALRRFEREGREDG